MSLTREEEANPSRETDQLVSGIQETVFFWSSIIPR